MSTTGLVYHALGARGYRCVRTDFVEGQVVITIEEPRERYRCSQCGSREVVAHGGPTRLFRTVPIGKKSVRLLTKVPRVECRRCGTIRQVRLRFAEPRRQYTHAFERYVLDLSRRMTMLDVARHLGISWDTVKEIQQRDLERRFCRPRLRDLRQIAIDEIAIGKGHRYVTVVLDLESGAVVFVGDGKGSQALDPFWRRLRASHARIRAVATDMSKAYIEAVRRHLPRAIHVFDRFHLVKLFNEKLSDLRRALQREATDLLKKNVLKGTRWLLLKNPENLDEGRRERHRLEEALRLNQPLATAYYLKEDLRQIWEQPDKATARRVLQDWIRRAEASCIKQVQQMATTVAIYRSGVLAYYDYPISTSPLEGTNNKIQTMKRQAYGFRDIPFFKLKILALHQTRYALVG